MIEDDDQTTEQADDEPLAEGEQSEAPAKAKAKDGAETETDEGEGADGEAEGAEDEEGDKPKKRRSGVDRLKRERDALRAEVETLRSRGPVAGDSASIDAEVLKRIGDPPKEADFEDYFEFQAQRSAYLADKRIVTREVAGQAQGAQTRQAQVFEDLQRDHQDRCVEAAEKIPDFTATMRKATAETHPTAPHVVQLLLESEKSALLQYHLAKNPSDLHRLNGLSPVSAAREMGRLEARLSLAKPNFATNAPPPVKHPKGGASPASQEARMEAYLKKQYGARA